MKMNRREWVRHAGLASGAAFLGGAWSSGRDLLARNYLPSLPAPATSGIDHIVVVTMENRSFDHLLGWLPNVNGKQAGLIFMDNSGKKFLTYAL